MSHHLFIFNLWFLCFAFFILIVNLTTKLCEQKIKVMLKNDYNSYSICKSNIDAFSKPTKTPRIKLISFLFLIFECSNVIFWRESHNRYTYMYLYSMWTNLLETRLERSQLIVSRQHSFSISPSHEFEETSISYMTMNISQS